MRKICGSVPRVHRDALALEVGGLGDAAVLAGHQCRPFRTREYVDRLDRVAVDPGEQSRGPRRGPEIDGAAIKEFQRLVGAQRLGPAHLDALVLQGLFQETLVLEDQAHRVVGCPIEADLLDLRRLAVTRHQQKRRGAADDTQDGATRQCHRSMVSMVQAAARGFRGSQDRSFRQTNFPARRTTSCRVPITSTPLPSVVSGVRPGT